MAELARRIFHPTDLSPDSEPAFAHALAIALARRASLTLLNASPEHDGDDWQRFPRVRETLERWGLLEPGSPKRAVLETLGVTVKKVSVEGGRATAAILEYLGDHPSDLVVMATGQREGLARLLRGSVAQRLARASHAPALFVPKDGRGFVGLATGALSLSRVLVPIASGPGPGAAVDVATSVASALGDRPVALLALHVGEAFPDVALPEGPDWRWERVLRTGDAVEQILALAREGEVDLIAMTSDGRDGWLDRFRGSHAERVVRGAPCPVIVLPVPEVRSAAHVG